MQKPTQVEILRTDWMNKKNKQKYKKKSNVTVLHIILFVYLFWPK